MECIALREVTKKHSWKGRRSGETIGYHQREEEVRILTTLYLENLLKDGENNYIDVLHPGNVRAELVTDDPLPDHPDEREHHVTNNILRTLYGDAFDIKTNGNKVEAISQLKALSVWDAWYETKERQLVNWVGDGRSAANPPRLKRVFPAEVDGSFLPFTAWRIGPFGIKGPVLFSLEIILKGESYRELVAQERTFPIDGPERLLARIEYGYIPRMDQKEHCKWKKELRKFRNYMSAGQSYDMVVLGDFLADEVEVLEKSGVTKASLQPESKHIGVRYVTDDRNFTMSLRYAARKFRKNVDAIRIEG